MLLHRVGVTVNKFIRAPCFFLLMAILTLFLSNQEYRMLFSWTLSSLLLATVTATWPILPEDLFVSDLDGGHEGYPWYRIPAMLRLPNGGIAVFAEGRKTPVDIGECSQPVT